MRAVARLCLAAIAVLPGCDAAKPCAAPTADLRSKPGEGTYSVTFQSDIDEEIELFWVDSHGAEVPQGSILPLSETTRESYGGHAFRVRQMGGERETLAEAVMQGSAKRIRIRVEACGTVAATQALPPESPRAAEFEALLHDLGRPCAGPSRDWSCVRYLRADDLRSRPCARRHPASPRSNTKKVPPAR